MTIDILLDPGSIVTPLQPYWIITATVSLPLTVQNVDAASTLAMAAAFAVRLQINLYTAFFPQTGNRRKRRMASSVQSVTGTIFFSYASPLVTVDDGKGGLETLVLTTFGFGIVYFLDDLFNYNTRRKRSLAEDQVELFSQVEESVSAMGVDGHACILRLICELQSANLSTTSLLAHVFSLFFTPTGGENYHIMKEYIEAEKYGRLNRRNCLKIYGKICPVSFFSSMRKLLGLKDPKSPILKKSNSKRVAVSYLHKLHPFRTQLNISVTPYDEIKLKT